MTFYDFFNKFLYFDTPNLAPLQSFGKLLSASAILLTSSLEEERKTTQLELNLKL